MSFVEDNSNRIDESNNDVVGIKSMWCAVLRQQWCEALNLRVGSGAVANNWPLGEGLLKHRVGGISYNRRMDMQRAQDWFGGKDFRMVCALSGVDSDCILEEFERQVAA